VVEGDDLVRRSIDDLSGGRLGHSEDSDSGCSGGECVGVETLLERLGEDEVLPGRAVYILHGCSPVTTVGEGRLATQTIYAKHTSAFVNCL